MNANMDNTGAAPGEPPPERTLLTAKSDYASAADQLLAGVSRELRVFDPALTEFNLDTPQRIALLRAFLLRNNYNRLYIVVHEPDQVKRNCARVMNLLAHFATAMVINRSAGDAAKVQDCFVLADDVSFVRRPVWRQPRGVYVRNDPGDAAIMRKRFEEIWESSLPGVSASTTGL